MYRISPHSQKVDVDLICSNCRKFNQSGSFYYEQAGKLQKFSERVFATAFKKGFLGDDGSDPKAPSSSKPSTSTFSLFISAFLVNIVHTCFFLPHTVFLFICSSLHCSPFRLLLRLFITDNSTSTQKKYKKKKGMFRFLSLALSLVDIPTALFPRLTPFHLRLTVNCTVRSRLPAGIADDFGLGAHSSLMDIAYIWDREQVLRKNSKRTRKFFTFSFL